MVIKLNMSMDSRTSFCCFHKVCNRSADVFGANETREARRLELDIGRSAAVDGRSGMVSLAATSKWTEAAAKDSADCRPEAVCGRLPVATFISVISVASGTAGVDVSAVGSTSATGGAASGSASAGTSSTLSTTIASPPENGSAKTSAGASANDGLSASIEFLSVVAGEWNAIKIDG